jgi:hypothetical protein
MIRWKTTRSLHTNFGSGICQAAGGICLRRRIVEGWRGGTHLLSVVDLPDDGLPTRPIRGSRGIGVQAKRYEIVLAGNYATEAQMRRSATVTFNDGFRAYR